MPEGDKVQRSKTCVLFDDFIGASKYRRWDIEADDLCGRLVDNELKLSRKFNREIGGFLAFQNPVHEVGGSMIGFTLTDAITD